jgi:signal peptidase
MRRKIGMLSLIVKVTLFFVCLVIIIPSIIRLCPFLISADNSYIVLGGSMQPTLHFGDLVFTVKVDPSKIEVGDIVAVKTESSVYMHRVIEKKIAGGTIFFKLKGDANEEPDSCYITDSEIIGKFLFSIPMGYLYTKTGYILITVTPLMLLTTYQIIKIYKIYNTREKWRKGLKRILIGRSNKIRKKTPILDTISCMLLIVLVVGNIYLMAPYFTPVNSFFRDKEVSRKNEIKAATWKVGSIITCAIYPNPKIKLGENIIISGLIKPPRIGVKVTLKYSVNASTIERIVTTDSIGSYNDTFVPEIAGRWAVQASWNGDNYYYGATSEEVTFTVLDERDNE